MSSDYREIVKAIQELTDSVTGVRVEVAALRADLRTLAEVRERRSPLAGYPAKPSTGKLPKVPPGPGPGSSNTPRFTWQNILAMQEDERQRLRERIAQGLPLEDWSPYE